MTSATGVRIHWSDLPTSVRDAAEKIIGGTVVSAVSQPYGFSPGSADRVRTADGRRAFVKAVSPAQNTRSPVMYRNEARISALLPGNAPVPRLLGCHDDGEWVALVLTDVDGRHPATPWHADELAATLDALHWMADALTPSPVPDLPTAAERFRDDFAGWRRLCDEPAPGLDPWAGEHLAELHESALRSLAALTGETLCHADIRADNLLIDRADQVVVVDWPWACHGPAWLDTLLLVVNVRLYGGHDTEALLRARAHVRDVEPTVLTGVLAGLAGFFTDATRRPAPQGLPTLRAFQRAHAEMLLPWIRERVDTYGW
jgi:aminoglycoside phosphotransferase (APT) family kinase protein